MDLINTQRPSALAASMTPAELLKTSFELSRFTASETLTRAVLGRLGLLDSAGTNTITIPLDGTNAATNFVVGDAIFLVNRGAGIWTIAGAVGVTLISLDSNLVFSGQGGWAAAVKEAANSWLVKGDLTT